jgi:hypothetical protein
MPAKTKFDPDVTVGELLFLLKLGEIQREGGVQGAFAKFRDQTGQSRDTVRSTFARIQDAVGGLDIASKDGGRIGISDFGHNVGRIGWIANALINIAKDPATDQTKLLQLVDGIRAEIVRRDEAGEL